MSSPLGRYCSGCGSWFIKENPESFNWPGFCVGCGHDLSERKVLRQEAEGVSECSDCGEEFSELMGCPDGAEVCQYCFAGH